MRRRENKATRTVGRSGWRLVVFVPGQVWRLRHIGAKSSQTAFLTPPIYASTSGISLSRRKFGGRAVECPCRVAERPAEHGVSRHSERIKNRAHRRARLRDETWATGEAMKQLEAKAKQKHLNATTPLEGLHGYEHTSGALISPSFGASGRS